MIATNKGDAIRVPNFQYHEQRDRFHLFLKRNESLVQTYFLDRHSLQETSSLKKERHRLF